MKTRTSVSLHAVIVGGCLLLGVMANSISAQGGDTATAFVDLLRYIPDIPGTRAEVEVNDYLAAAVALGLDRPGPEAGYDELVGYARELTVEGAMLPGPFISGLDGYALLTLKSLRTRAGYDLRDLTASVVAGLPPERFSAVVLDIPLQGMREKLLRAEGWPAPEVEDFRGVSILIWGEDFEVDAERRLTPPIYDSLGRGARLAFLENTMLYTVWTPGIKGMIAAALDEIPALADVEDFRLLGEGLGRLGVYSAMLSADVRGAQEVRDEGHCQILLRPYTAFAVGIGRDAAGFFMGLVLVHASEEDAGTNMGRLPTRLNTCWSLYAKRPWGEFFDLEKLDLSREGRVLLAKVYLRDGCPRSIWARWVVMRDPLLLHE